MILAGFMALALKDALGAFNILLQIGAGTGLLFLLRWFWHRINAYSELVAMIVSFAIAIYFELIYSGALLAHERMTIAVVITTVVWLVATLLTRPTDKATLQNFYDKIRPYKAGWKNAVNIEATKAFDRENESNLPREIFKVFLGSILVYAALFSTGYFLYGDLTKAMIALFTSVVCGVFLWRIK